jgi:hypothetical protein
MSQKPYHDRYQDRPHKNTLPTRVIHVQNKNDLIIEPFPINSIVGRINETEIERPLFQINFDNLFKSIY